MFPILVRLGFESFGAGGCLPLLLCSDEIAVHFFDLGSQIPWKKLDLYTGVTQELIASPSYVGIRVEHSDNDASDPSIYKALGAGNFGVPP